jgi:hypothetical protein
VGNDNTMVVWKAKNNIRRAKEARLDVWRGKVGNNNTMAVWKAKITSDEPKRLVWMCGEIRRAATTPWLCGKQKEQQTSQRGSSGCVER